MQAQSYQNLFHDPIAKNDIDYKSVYTSCFPMIRSMILKNGGTIEDARDIFQETIIVLFQNTSKEKFQLSVSTCTYLYSIARNKWLKHLRDNGRKTGLDDTIELQAEGPVPDDDELKQKQRLLIKHLAGMGDKCQSILQLFFEGMPGEKLSQELGFSSYEYYRVAKNRCTETLKKLIQQDPLFKELK